jgi:gluconate kinase
MASLLLITGPPGAGKSTVAQALAERCERSVLVEGDAFFAFLARGAISPWLPEASDQNEVVTRAAASAAGQYVSGGYSTVYDGVVGPWFLPTFIAATGLGYLHYLVLLPTLERCVARVATRQGHGFTDEAATQRMHQQFARANIDERHVIIEPPDQVEAVADRILAAVDSETLVYRSQSS